MFNKIKENKFFKEYCTEVHLRVKFSLSFSLFFNVAYALLQAAFGALYESVWFYTLAGYYAVLAVMRLFLLHYIKKNEQASNLIKEWKLYKRIGLGILFLNVPVSAISIAIVEDGKILQKDTIVTIAIATYTFASLAMAIINVHSYRKYERPVYSATKAVSLASASESMLILETTMLYTFGTKDELVFRQIMLTITATVLFIFLLTLAFYMVMRARKSERKLKNG